MARPFKEQLEYYHHDINMWDDDKFLDLRDEMGLLGYGILTALLDDIYLNSYYRKWTDTHEKRFRLKYNISLEDIKKAISYLTGTHKPLTFENIDQSDYFFNRQLYLDDKVLTSKSIQKFYLSGCTRRKQVNINRRYWLLVILQETDNEKQERLASPKKYNMDDKNLFYSVVNRKKVFLNMLIDGYIENKSVREEERTVNVYNNPKNVYNNPVNVSQKLHKYTKDRKGKEIEIERKGNRKERDIPPQHKPSKCKHKWPCAEMIDQLRDYWNEKGLSEYKLFSLHFPDLGELLNTLNCYTFDEIEKAISNYADILKSGNHEPFPRYTDFHGFLKNGIPKFADNTDCFERCKIADSENLDFNDITYEDMKDIKF